MLMILVPACVSLLLFKQPLTGEYVDGNEGSGLLSITWQWHTASRILDIDPNQMCSGSQMYCKAVESTYLEEVEVRRTMSLSERYKPERYSIGVCCMPLWNKVG